MVMTKPEVIERFHLALLQVMPQHLPSANYVVKGGANLRLFMESVRRSEDISYSGRLERIENSTFELTWTPGAAS
jgi:hypothetical protein